MMDESRSNTASNLETLSIDSDEAEDVQPWDNLLRKLSVDKVERLAAIFKDEEKKQNGGVSKDEFVSHVDRLIGNFRYCLQSALLFEEIDSGDTGFINWEQFSDFVLGNIDSSSAPKLELSISSIFAPPHVQKEAVAKIVSIETEKYFCYAVLSKFGRVGLYDGNFNFLTSYHVAMAREDLARRESQNRRRNRWITDAVFLLDALAFVVASSARTLTVYDASGLNHVPLFLVLGLPNVIHTLDYYSAVGTNQLFMGDDGGELTCLKFCQAKTELLRVKQSDRLSIYFWRELEAEKRHVLIKRIGRIHKEAVRKIQYVRSNNSLVTCSRDEGASVVIKHLDGRLGSYTFQMNRGASCFELSKQLNILATGSDDGVVRLWNPFSTVQPIGTFKSHKSGIVDLRMLEEESCLITLSCDGVLKLWSVKRQQCLQSLRVAFPSFGMLGKFVEWGANSIYPGPKRSGTGTDETWKRSNILVTCCDFVANIRTTFYQVDCPFELNAILPPPPLQTSVLIPSTWNRSQMKDVPERTPDPTSDNLGEIITRRIQDLRFVLERDMVEEEDRSDINFLIATLEAKKLQMRAMVENYAPYSALELKEIRDIQLGPDLPVPGGKRVRNIVEKTRKMLEAANNRTSVLSRSSASRTSRSSRSSIVTFD